ncbi:ferric reductase NAD binding domain-containing protein [Nemania sp. FL0031]|nr:ferric reductase NAD binding domain-containing protein [Nemania sp. FL0031]
MAKAISAKQLSNERALKILAGVISGVLALLIINHWVRVLYVRARRCRSNPQPTGSSALASRFMSFSRYIRRTLIKGRAGFPSTGHAILVSAYVVVNVLLMFTHLDYSKLNLFAARAGWLATGNLAVLVFLALKNTPLAALIGYPHNHLNYFHQVAGYVTIGLMILHAALYPPYYVAIKFKPETLIEKDNVMGIISGAAMFLILLSVFLIKRTRYEVFYVAHIVLFIVSLVTLGLHRPEWVRRIPVITLFAGGLWFSDRLLRGVRLLCNLLNNEAMITALPGIDGGDKCGTRVLLKKPFARATPGAHCFLWVPGVRAFETHPFTIVSNGPDGLELVAQTEDGFTRSLYEMAQAGKSGIWAAADGPYGAVHDLADYDKILLVAGGSGVTFALGLALNALESRSASVGVEKQQQEISLIWATRRIEHTKWFDDHAKTLASSHSPRFCLTYFITGDSSNTTKPSVNSSQGSISLENQETSIGDETGVPCKGKDSANTIIVASDDTTRGSFPVVRHQKLNLEEIVLEAVRLAGKDQRVLVACCGPNRMTNDVRNAAAQCMTAEGPSITLLCESFSW